MRRRGAAAGTTVVLVAGLALPVAAQTDAHLPLDTDFARSVDTVSAGLAHTHAVSPRRGEAAPLSVHVLAADLAAVRVEVALALDQILGQETPSSVVRRRGALAGVNGGFSVSNDPWHLVHGDPNGFLVVDGEVLSEPVEDRPALGLCEGGGVQRVFAVRPLLRVVLRVANTEVSARGLNRARTDEDLVVYTPAWGRSTVTDPGGVEVVVRAGRAAHVMEAGSARIPDDGFVVSAAGAPAEAVRRLLTPGTPVELVREVTDRTGAPLPVEGCSYTSAGPVIAEEGVARTDYTGEAYREGFVTDRHPRTAVGVSRDGATLYLVTVDGRQEGHSAGATLEELAELVLAEGAWWVYNLDGGGSTAMVVGGEVVNQPSDGRERRRCDVLVVTAR